MDIHIAVLIFVTGLFSGFFNTVGGGASLISLPLLIFLGLPPVIANATNRLAIAVQNLAAAAGFTYQGVAQFRYSAILAISSTAGAIWGAYVALDMNAEVFKTVLAAVMVLAVGLILSNPHKKWASHVEAMSAGRQWSAFILFFFIGIYGGFMQAAVGLIMLGALTGIHGMDLIKANTIKVMVMFTYTFVSVIIFAWHGKIDWSYGLVLAAGNAISAWITSQWSVKKGEEWVRSVLVIAVLILAMQLFGVWNFLYRVVMRYLS